MTQNRIKKIIKESGLTLTNVAKRLNVTRQSIENWNKTDNDEDYLKVKEAIAQYVVVDEYSIERFKEMEERINKLEKLVVDLTEENLRLRVQSSQIDQLDKSGNKVKG